MSRWPKTRAGRWGARKAQDDLHDAQLRALLQSNPRTLVENILSRYAVCQQVSRRLISNPGDTPAAIRFVAENLGVPVEVVQECLTIEALETGK